MAALEAIAVRQSAKATDRRGSQRAFRRTHPMNVCRGRPAITAKIGAVEHKRRVSHADQHAIVQVFVSAP